MKIYVGNLSFSTNEEAIRALFAPHGEIAEVSIASDRDTGRSRGFAFVTIPDDSGARAAIEALNGKEVDGRTIVVNEAKPREDRAGGRGGRGGYEKSGGGYGKSKGSFGGGGGSRPGGKFGGKGGRSDKRW